MPQSDDRKPPASQPRRDDRQARLAEQLRVNLQRRKAQARARRAGEADLRPDGLAAAARADGDDEGPGKDESGE